MSSEPPTHDANRGRPTAQHAKMPRRQPRLSIFAILSINVVIDGLLPWALIWLSNAFLFDLPAWSAEALLAASLTVSTLIISASWLRTAHIGRRAPHSAAPAQHYRLV